ncbi:hypothetical protein TNCV_1280331 [Trichonephila clavipes]|nr:hypothetical protein TNCV_1280331 [Trichonephila clavipes]
MGNMDEKSALSSSPIFIYNVSRMFSMGWVPCRGTGITHIQVLQQTLQVKLMATVCLFLASASDRWSIRRGLETRYRAISLHNIHPTPLEPIESTWSSFTDPVVSSLIF